MNWAAIDPTTRWIVARDAHIRGRFQYSRLVNDLIGGRQPVVTFPSHPAKGRLQIKIFDRRTPPPRPRRAVARSGDTRCGEAGGTRTFEDSQIAVNATSPRTPYDP